MAGINLASGFNRTSANPLDLYATVADLTARDAIDSGVRFEGMLVYVVSEETNFQLIGGITNGDWAELSGSGGGGIATVEGYSSGSHTLTEDPERTNRIILLNATLGNITITLPAGSATTIGTLYTFKRTDAVETNTVTIQRAGADDIDEGNSQTLPYQWSRLAIRGLTSVLWGVF